MQRKQEQSGGTGSTNVQAGGNVVIHGVSAAEARDIALDVFKVNALTLSGIAEQTARDRAERITSEYLEQLGRINPAGLSSVQDPDMLHSIYNAQSGYARSGDEDLEAALVDLLVERSGQTTGDLKALVLNQAIECVPRLTIGQRKAMAVSFLVRRTRYVAPLILLNFYHHLNTNFMPFTDIVSNKMIDYQYAQSAGVGAMVPSTLTMEDAFLQSYCGFVTEGFTLDQAKGQLANHVEDDQIHNYTDDRSIFIPSLRNAEMLQVNAVSIADIKELQAAKGLAPKPGNAGPLETLYLYGQMLKPQMRQDMASHVPSMAQLFDHWNTEGLSNFDLTAIGVAIGHAYWRRMTGATTPLDVWL